MAGNELVIKVLGDTSSLERALRKAGRQSDTFGQRVKRGARIAGFALAGTLAVAAKIGFDELAEGQKVAAQTNAVLKSTGGVANVTAKHVDTMATSLSEMSGIDDELIASGENLLLTFRNIRNEAGKGNDIFDQATAAALDLSVALGKDMSSASIMLGKAVNDPVKGLTALGRAGIQFTDAQKKAVKEMVATGDTLGAQKLILAEVTAQVGGSAEAYGNTLPGQIGKAREAFANMTGSLMLMFLPAMTAVAGAAQRMAETFQKHPRLAKAFTVAIIALTAALLAASVAQAALNLAVLANPYVAVAALIIALGVAVVVAYKKFEKFRAVVDFFRRHWQLLLFSLGPTAIILATIAKTFGKVSATIKTLIGWVNSALGPFRTLIGLMQTAASLLPSFGGGSGGQPQGGGRGSQAPGASGRPNTTGSTAQSAGGIHVSFNSTFPPTEEQARRAAESVAQGFRSQGSRQTFRLQPGI